MCINGGKVGNKNRMENFETYSVYEIFTPSIPAKEAFVERVKITNRLVEALRTPGMQVIIYGHSGSGKSTLIERKLFELYENHITTSCIKGMSFEAVLLDAFDQLDPFYKSAEKSSNTTTVGAEIAAQWLTISAAKSRVMEGSSSRLLPPQLTVQNLARFVGAARACWVLEDFHKLEPTEKIKLAQAMKMFMDMAKYYPDIKAVAVGAVGTAREVVQYDNEMRNRVSEIEVKLMDPPELAQIVNIGERKMRVKFDIEVARTIVRFSNGLASVCHQLCLKTCLAAGVETTAEIPVLLTGQHFDRAVEEYVEASSDSTRDRFDRACRVQRTRKNDNFGLILGVLCQFDLDGATVGDLSKKILKMEPGYRTNNLSRYLKLLQTEAKGSVVRFDSASGYFSYSDPFVRSYALAYFANKQKTKATSMEVTQSKFLQLVKEAMLRAREDMLGAQTSPATELAGKGA